MKIYELKNDNKQIALNIKELKSQIRNLQKEQKYTGRLQYDLVLIRHNYRLLHITYCLLRGKLYDQIETPRSINKLKENDWNQIETYKEAYREENVCACA